MMNKNEINLHHEYLLLLVSTYAKLLTTTHYCSYEPR